MVLLRPGDTMKTLSSRPTSMARTKPVRLIACAFLAGVAAGCGGRTQGGVGVEPGSGSSSGSGSGASGSGGSTGGSGGLGSSGFGELLQLEWLLGFERVVWCRRLLRFDGLLGFEWVFVRVFVGQHDVRQPLAHRRAH
jgi:hypothetical protein